MSDEQEAKEKKVRYTRALRPDAQPFDEIRIRTVPRFKTSEVSGDEWRIAAVVELRRKGRTVHCETRRNIEVAAAHLSSIIDEAIDDGKAFYAGMEGICDQEGCLENATVVYRRKMAVCCQCGSSKPDECGFKNRVERSIRAFCQRHAVRGNASLDDRDDNYELIAGDPKAVDEEDKSQAVLIGIVDGDVLFNEGKDQ